MNFTFRPCWRAAAENLLTHTDCRRCVWLRSTGISDLTQCAKMMCELVFLFGLIGVNSVHVSLQKRLSWYTGRVYGHFYSTSWKRGNNTIFNIACLSCTVGKARSNHDSAVGERKQKLLELPKPVVQFAVPNWPEMLRKITDSHVSEIDSKSL